MKNLVIIPSFRIYMKKFLIFRLIKNIRLLYKKSSLKKLTKSQNLKKKINLKFCIDLKGFLKFDFKFWNTYKKNRSIKMYIKKN